MSQLVEKLIRPELKSLKPYESARRLFAMADQSSAENIWLNANENPVFPNVDISPNLLNRYPDFQPEPLISAYANYSKLSLDNVLATRGADEGIELLIRTFCNSQSDDNIVICPPTYGMYKISAETAGVKVNEVPLTESMQLDMPKLKQSLTKAKLLFLCSPNNPTGDCLDRDDIITLLKLTRSSCIVVADEAYIEFCAEASVADLIKQYPNLVVLRTLSKAFGLAGIRCGFTLAQPDIIDALKKVIAPYPIPAPVAQIATQVLSEQGLDWMRKQVAELNQRRDQFIENAKNYSCIKTVLPSNTNFVLLKLNNECNADAVMSFFVDQHVLLRNQSKQHLLENTIRVTIGSEKEMDKVNAIFSTIGVK